MVSALSPCSAPPVATYPHYGTRRTYAPGQFLYLSGHDQASIFIIEQGLVRLGTYAEDGEETTVAVLKSGDALGNLFTEPVGGREFARALGPVRVRTVDQHAFYLLTTSPAFAEAFTRALGTRIQQVDRHFRMLTLPKAGLRLVAFLQFLAEACGYPCENATVIDNFLTHDDLAGIINTSRQSVSACLIALEQEGKLCYDRRRITLLSNF